ncbi:hypothetical protein, partial [Xanthomonas citri]
MSGRTESSMMKMRKMSSFRRSTHRQHAYWSAAALLVLSVIAGTTEAARKCPDGSTAGSAKEGLINSPQMRDTTVSCRGLIHAA